MMKVYLAGPVLGKDVTEAVDWRVLAQVFLAKHDILGISPLRCETPSADGTFQADAGKRWGTPQSIMWKNLFDVRNTDATLAYLPLSLTKNRPSIGTLAELGMAHALQKPIFLATDDPYLSNHPWIRVAAIHTAPALEDVLHAVAELYSNHNGRSNY